MGRPPLNMKVINVRLPPETLEKIDSLVGTHRRPGFVRDAVEAALKLAEIGASSERAKADKQ